MKLKRSKSVVKGLIWSYLSLLILMISLALLSSTVLVFFATSLRSSTPDSVLDFVLMLEMSGREMLDLVEVTLGAIIGALVASTQAAPEIGDEELKQEDENQSRPIPGKGVVIGQHVLYPVRVFGFVLLLCVAGGLFSMSAFAYVAQTMLHTNIPNVEMYDSLFLTFHGFAQTFINSVEIVVGGMIGALSATLNQVMNIERS